jgi:hypothetical protein
MQKNKFYAKIYNCQTKKTKKEIVRNIKHFFRKGIDNIVILEKGLHISFMVKFDFQDFDFFN